MSKLTHAKKLFSKLPTNWRQKICKDYKEFSGSLNLQIDDCSNSLSVQTLLETIPVELSGNTLLRSAKLLQQVLQTGKLPGAIRVRWNNGRLSVTNNFELLIAMAFLAAVKEKQQPGAGETILTQSLPVVVTAA